jgi:hypothetical protein
MENEILSNLKLNYYVAFLFMVFSFNRLCGQSLELAVTLQKAYELDGYTDRYLFNKAEKVYLELIKIDSVDIKANYGLGSLYHNKGVILTTTIQDSTKSGYKTKLKLNQKEAAECFKKAIPYLDRYNRLIDKGN